MTEQSSPPPGPDLAQGIALGSLADGAMLLGHVGNAPVLLARTGDAVFAVGASCTHYGGPLAEGLRVGDTIRCPWHHACFSLRTGAALRAPALNPVDCWQVERQGESIRVREKQPMPAAARRPAGAAPSSIVIIGGGAAGNCAAETARNEGYEGYITILSADSSVPYDRPNLSKDYLAGNAPEEWIPLRSPDFYREHAITLRLGTQVGAIHPGERAIELEDGTRLSYGALLIASGAEPIRLTLPGSDLAHVHYLRSLADSRAIIEAAKSAKRVLVIGASFIGLEVAASLRARNLEVHVVAPEAIPMERILGPEIGSLVRRIHEEHGVHFHLGTTASAIERAAVVLKTGEKIPADLVVVGVGVRPNLALAEKAGLAMDRGLVVDQHLETSTPGIFAAGDLARWPDVHSGEKIRVEHWVVAERQGQTAARNMIGGRERFDAVPFFWSVHYDLTINYVGHAEKWNAIEVDGSVERRDCKLTYRLGERAMAYVTIGRDLESLRAEFEIENHVLRLAS